MVTRVSRRDPKDHIGHKKGQYDQMVIRVSRRGQNGHVSYQGVNMIIRVI